MLATSGALARDEITCPSGTASGSTCRKCGDNCTATLTGGKMTVSGTGDMYDYTRKSASGTPSWNPDTPWADHRLEITSIEIGNDITKVGDYAFALSYNATDLKLGNSLESIGSLAFNSSSISELKIPASVKILKDGAFMCPFTKTTSATSVVFEEGSKLETIGNAALSYLRITNIDIPDTVTLIDKDAFYEAKSLTNVGLPDNPNLVMGDQVFRETKIRSIVLPDGASANSTLRNLPGTVNVYCTQATIDAGHCNSSYLYKSPLTVTHYERDGDHFNVYNSQGEIVAKYGSFADFGTTNYYKPKEKRLYYTPAEAAEAIKQKPNGQKLNKITFTFK